MNKLKAVAPNLDQILSLVRAVLLIIGTFMISSASSISPTDWQALSGAVLTIIPIVWSMFAHRTPSEPTPPTPVTGVNAAAANQQKRSF